jgi:predicted DsbA family dithiol-disulfide isomerase
VVVLLRFHRRAQIRLRTVSIGRPVRRLSPAGTAPGRPALIPDMRVDIWSDVVCPWCYVGKRRFEAALADFPHRDEVEVHWRSFELDPTAPPVRDIDRIDHLASKYGIPREQAQAMERQINEAGQAAGIDFQLHRSRGGNSFDAHRLLHLAADHGLGDETKERLLRGYFSEGEPIGDPATLARLAVEAGLPAAEVAEVLAGDRYADAVRADERQATPTAPPASRSS